MSRRESKPSPEQAVVGCIDGLWSLFVTTPMWLAMLFAILQAIEGLPTWAWVLFWCYVPAFVFGVIIAIVGKAVVLTK